MRTRVGIAVGCGALWLLSSCDRTTVAPLTPATTTQAAEPRRIPLVAIPLTAVVPDDWDVRAGPGGRLVLNGKTPEGTEINLELTRREPIKADALPAMLATLAPTTARSAAAADAGLLTRHVSDRNGMTVVEETERLGSPDQASDVVPFRWRLQYILTDGGLTDPVYEIDVAGLTQVLYERNQLFLRSILDSVQYDASRR